MRVALAILFAGVLAAFFALGGLRYLTPDTIREHRDALVAFTQAHEGQAIVVAFFVFVAAVTFSLPGAALLTVTCGFLFGRWMGSLIVVFAATIGAAALFLGARYVFGDAARARLGAWGERINAGFTRHGLSYMLFLRLVPIPFFLVNLAPALTSLPLRTFVLATFVGVIPSTLILANLGEALVHVDSMQDLVSWQMLVALALLGVLALLPVGVRKLSSRRAGGA